MDELICNATTNLDTKEITISGLEDNLILNYTGDIDFTDLISKLTELIDDDEDKVLNFSCSESEDEIANLILKTIKEIFEIYNNILQIEDKTEVI